MDNDLDLFEAAFHAAPDAILLVDDDGRYIGCNRTATELLATDESRLRTHRVGDFSRGVMRLRAPEWWTELRRSGRLAVRHVLTDATGVEHVVDTRGRAEFLPGRHLLVVRRLEDGRSAHELVLSPREREVLSLFASGLNGRQVAEKLVLSPLTVRTHVRNAIDKLDARTRAHAIALALRHGEIQP
jgi:DNA-binding CsgD family transcriptional regulator